MNEWYPALHSDTSLKDSDKKFTCGGAEYWHVQGLFVTLTTTASAGNRVLVVEIQDTADAVISQIRAVPVQVASKAYYYHISPGALPADSAVRDTDYIAMNMPANWYLRPGYDIRIYDESATAADSDQMDVKMMVLARRKIGT